MKRFVDVILSGILLVILFPIFAVLFILVRSRLGSPVLFVQIRPGFKAQPFKMVKFRTMKEIYDDNGNLLPDSERLTSFGHFLRSSSLDELPELWNVFKGDMSLVGPRPLLMDYLSLYSDEQYRRHDVRPGITGWAQVNGRNAITWEEKFRLDTWYVDNQSIMLDMRIIWITIRTVILREGISADGHVTMPPFTGRSLDE
ncbi:sugar transferase [Thalassolituus oleivorans]|uniref:sugar transferase n=1 Tax=Thalassolituus oleivorans TaxID=187493 RepID=UPI00240A222A|nr:sugar transferase [Thalassolituus oleivorans]MDF1641267.1 sugar transferase [Thalassolituus oleivorans]